MLVSNETISTRLACRFVIDNGSFFNFAMDAKRLNMKIITTTSLGRKPTEHFFVGDGNLGEKIIKKESDPKI